MELLTIPNFNKFTKITLKVASVIIFYSVIKRCPKFVTFIDISLASMKTSLVRSLWEAVPVCSLTHGYRVYLPKWPSMEGINLSAAFYIVSVQFSSVESLSPVRLFTTPWTAACQAFLSITNSWSSLRLASVMSVMPSSHLILGRPLLLLPPIHQSLFQWVNASHEVAKVLEFQL